MKNKIKFTEPYSLLATFFGVGNIKTSPGTFGSFIAVLLWVLYNNFFVFFGYSRKVSDIFWVAFLVLLFFIGAKAIDMYTKASKSKDDPAIVIDEVVGQLLTLFLTYHLVSTYIYVYYNQSPVTVYVAYYVLAFVLFRIFAEAKPSFIGRIEKRYKNGYGIMMDDIVAGVAAAATLNFIVILIIYLR